MGCPMTPYWSGCVCIALSYTLAVRGQPAQAHASAPLRVESARELRQPCLHSLVHAIRRIHDHEPGAVQRHARIHRIEPQLRDQRGTLEVPAERRVPWHEIRSALDRIPERDDA